MRKKILMLMACGCLLAGSAHAQWVVTDPTNLAQSIINTTKEIVQTSKTVKNTLDNFKEVEKLYNESKKYYDALKKVNDLVRDAQRVKETILMVGEISDIYVNNYKKMLSDPNFRPTGGAGRHCQRLYQTARREQQPAQGAEASGEHHHAEDDRQGTYGRGGSLLQGGAGLPQPRALLHEQEHLRELPQSQEAAGH